MGDYDFVVNGVTFLVIVGLGTVAVGAVMTAPAWVPIVTTICICDSVKNKLFSKKKK